LNLKKVNRPMTQEGFKRKLTAIFSADVIGYSRLMRDDEEATVRDLAAHRVLMTEIIQQHRGRVVDSPGDNLLAEFGSVVDAVNCSIKIQWEMKQINTSISENRRMEFRIGINLGDVIEQDGQLFGDGVNIAARVEGLAAGGGISISGTVYEHIKDKLSLGYHFLGEQNVKNIPEPIRVYRLLTDPEAAGMVIGERGPRPERRHWAVMAAVVLLLGTAAFAIWNFYLKSVHTPEKVLSTEKTSAPLSDKPSIAVLPFKNLSGDTKQEYFSDGVTNDIITDLSKFSGVFIIASNTMFTYKNKSVKIEEIGQELGVRYVVEGSVQKVGDRVRINAQLIDATTGHHLWAERYERDLKDIFALQSEIVQTIVATLAIKVGEAELARAMRKDTDSLEAYDYLLRGAEYIGKGRSANIKAKEMFRKALDLDPDYGSVYYVLGWTYFMDATSGWTEFPVKAMQRAQDLARKALSLDESNAGPHRLLGTCYLYQGEYDLAISELRRAIALNPNSPGGYHNLGWGLLYAGLTDDAIKALETALRLDPNRRSTPFFLGLGYYFKGRYDDAIRTLKRGLIRAPNHENMHITLAATYARAGHIEDAAREAKKVFELNPFFEVDTYGTAFRNPEDRKRIQDDLRKAGLD
jgi:adenylate cyclase